MFDELNDHGVIHMSDALDALSELEKNTSQAITAQRTSKRIEIRAKVWIQPGSSSQRGSKTVEALTADISNGGCMLLSPRPIMVGDIFWLQFPDDHIQIESLLARCLRCRFVREDAFEVGIRFLSDIDVANVVSEPLAMSL